MASIVFPQYSKHLSLSTTHTYNYVYVPAIKTSFPTILFLHGFPSSSYNWRHQITFFAAHGSGVLAPDLLGYGGTSKPAAVEEYKSKKVAAEIAEIEVFSFFGCGVFPWSCICGFRGFRPKLASY